MKSMQLPSIDVVKLCCKALEEKKAGQLQVMDVGSLSSITDFLVIATATSEPHLRALRVELEKCLDGAGVGITGMDADQGSGWMVVDAFDVMIHLFTAERREQYGLEKLWKDGEAVAVEKLLSAGKARGKRSAARTTPRKPGKRRTPAKQAGSRKSGSRRK
jgi:ribosome-associated protein